MTLDLQERNTWRSAVHAASQLHVLQLAGTGEGGGEGGALSFFLHI